MSNLDRQTSAKDKFFKSGILTVYDQQHTQCGASILECILYLKAQQNKAK
jgi:hypothetical protein